MQCEDWLFETKTVGISISISNSVSNSGGDCHAKIWMHRHVLCVYLGGVCFFETRDSLLISRLNERKLIYFLWLYILLEVIDKLLSRITFDTSNINAKIYLKYNQHAFSFQVFFSFFSMFVLFVRPLKKSVFFISSNCLNLSFSNLFISQSFRVGKARKRKTFI